MPPPRLPRSLSFLCVAAGLLLLSTPASPASSSLTAASTGTQGYPPSAPGPLAPTEGSVTSSSVHLTWRAATSSAGDIEEYDLQFRELAGSTASTASASAPSIASAASSPASASTAWRSVPGVVGQASSGINEVQTITTRADFGQTIAAGAFVLAFYGSPVGVEQRAPAVINTLDPEEQTRTAPIPFDATADEMREAVNGLANVELGGTTVHVVR